MKPEKHLRKQAAKAEAAARRTLDEEISENLLAMAHAYRSQADILEAKQQANKKSKSRGRPSKAVTW
jgi:hypothetical protein